MKKQIKEVESIGIVILSGNKTLLVRNGNKSEHIAGVYGTAAGRIEEGESLLEAAKRELEEETGLIANERDILELPKKYVADIKRKNGEMVRFHHTVFLCIRYSGKLKASDETVPEWVDVDQVSTLNLLPNIEDIIQQAIEYKKNL